MKKTVKKLTLSRETLRALVDKSFEEVRGGTASFVYSNCYFGSNCSCRTTKCL
jgi:hypothetical protein